ncbi:NADH-quinone oxidoreductase subunit L [Pirellula sp. SH-Sr6A]|uniref:proton-conducting transporter transmembrane domain-containing protein n=1 Tax=Pirellula sp. SH-Sr6A TaxID=1632865 RepID=UPI00078D733E|nr:proton-conducting transporter membrane subunit [Pirellula sp. SH-Sr6A]AMV31062.1 NADH-quinone oxidoreductase subunit L [Pirellula sp. SH-Sr6A]
MSIIQIVVSNGVVLGEISLVLACLIGFISWNVLSFSSRYMSGDRLRQQHLIGLSLLAIASMVFVIADHLFVLMGAWLACNLLLVKLMVHKREWRAAVESGRLAIRSLLIGFSFLTIGLLLLANSTGTTSLQVIAQTEMSTSWSLVLSLICIAIAAWVQGGIWPFHRWLLSSLNSPTPVSAMMHAGVVNGGGILLLRLAPILSGQSWLLPFLFLVGLVSAVLGTSWKLLQSDVKRMLACSTLGQMGFMMMQIGMGLFGPALSHLFWHSLFKAYLFLSSNSVLAERRNETARPIRSVQQGAGVILAGTCGAATFLLTSQLSIEIGTTSIVMVLLAWMTSAQAAVVLLCQRLTLRSFCSAAASGAFTGGLYGFSLYSVEIWVPSLRTITPEPMGVIYGIGVTLLFLLWLTMLLGGSELLERSTIGKRLYVSGMNASRSTAKTATSLRTAYKI